MKAYIRMIRMTDISVYLDAVRLILEWPAYREKKTLDSCVYVSYSLYFVSLNSSGVFNYLWNTLFHSNISQRIPNVPVSVLRASFSIFRTCESDLVLHCDTSLFSVVSCLVCLPFYSLRRIPSPGSVFLSTLCGSFSLK